jgi:hypothetical protein
VKACKGAGQVWRLGITFHVPGTVRECEGMNSHTPKWAPVLRVEVPMNSWIFREWLQGSKPIGLKILERKCLKWACMTHLDISNTSYGQKRAGSQIWLPTTKSREPPWFPCVQVACDIPWENFRQGLQLCFKPHLDWRSVHKVMPRLPNPPPKLWESQLCEYWDSITTKGSYNLLA